jgi:glycosyltransferase involved in cell wall biosynthesis
VTDSVVLHIGKVKGVSGSENHLLLLLPELRARGWDARFLLLHEDEPGAWEFARRLEEVGVPLEGLRLPSAASPFAFSRIVQTIRRHRPAIVHTHLVHADFHGLTAAALARVPVRVSTKHGFNAFRSVRGFGFGDRTVGRLADVQIAISHGLARYLALEEGFSETAFEVVHYGILAGDPPPAPPPGKRLAMVGRLIPIKGHVHLLEALRRVADPDLRLELAGDGELRGELERRVDALGLGEAVTFLGRVPTASSVFERSAIVVVPSLGEGFGMVALEAMERGRAVVASAVGGLPEIVEDGVTGLLVPPADPAALGDALATLLADPARVAAMGEAGRARALEVFTQERCTSRTEELYDAALAGAGRPRRR